MRGRATQVALPALAIVALVGIVAIAATGSTPGGSSDSRAPSEGLLDALFTLGILAVIGGAILLVWGLAQRQAIARQVASGRYPRFTLGSFLVLAGIIAILVRLFSHLSPPERATVDEETVLGGGNPVPTLPGETDQLKPYEPSISWIPIVLVVALVLGAALAYVVAERRSRRQRQPREVLATELADALDEALDDLRAETDPRRAIIAAYARVERVLAANGIARRSSETAEEYLVRVLRDLELDPAAIGRLTALFAEAKFSHHEVDAEMKEEAIAALEHVRDELRALRERPERFSAEAPQAATS